MILNQDLSPKKIINKVSIRVGQLDRIPTEFDRHNPSPTAIYVDLSMPPNNETPTWNAEY